MKKIALIALSCLTLGACDTMNSMSMPTMDMFKNDTATAKADKSLENIAAKAESEMQIKPASAPTPPSSSSALQTELNELEMLTGTRIQVSTATPPVSPEIPLAEDLQPIAPVEESVKIEEIQEVVEVVEVQEPEPTPSVVSKEIQAAPIPIPAPEPVIEKIVEPAPPPMPAPMVVETPKIVEPMTADSKPIFTDADLKLSSANGCPQINIMPAARSITYFDTMMPTDMTARASISEIRGGCEVVAGGMEIDLDILMKGTITPKGRFEGNVNEEAFMTFPYFVSVSTPQGLPVDKQILATAMRFRPSVDYLDHAEKITQFIPMDNVATAANYTITVGYQLTRKQLDYNRVVASARPNDRRVSPDTIPARRLSVNPLAE